MCVVVNLARNILLLPLDRFETDLTHILGISYLISHRLISMCKYIYRLSFFDDSDGGSKIYTIVR